LLQVTLYAWDAGAKRWEVEPIATSDRGVWGEGKLWQHNLTLQAAAGSERAKAWQRGRPGLPRGRYLIKVHVDAKDALAKDWQAMMGDADFVGQAEVESRWEAGYGSMTVVEASGVRR
jgi:hypothetical protein